MIDKQFLVTSSYYLLIALVASFFGCLAVYYGKKSRIADCGFGVIANMKSKEKSKPNKIFFVLSALVILLPLIFMEKGVDRSTYVELFQTATFAKVFDYQNQEPGFMLVNFILKTIFGTNKYVPFIFYYSLMVWCVYFVIYQLRDSISVPFAIFIFATLYTVQSINLMRIYVAGSIILVASYELLKKKNLRAALLWLFAVLIHYSSTLYVFVFFVLFYYNILHDKYNVKTYVLIVLLSIVFIGFIVLIPYIRELPILDRYNSYFDKMNFSHIGFLQPLLYVPLIAIAIYFVKIYGSDAHLNLYIANILICFLCGMLSYMIDIIGRSFALFMYPFIIGLPHMYRHLKTRCRKCVVDNNLLLKGEHILGTQLIIVFLYIYVTFKYILYMLEYINLDGIGIL